MSDNVETFKEIHRLLRNCDHSQIDDRVEKIRALLTRPAPEPEKPRKKKAEKPSIGQDRQETAGFMRDE